MSHQPKPRSASAELFASDTPAPKLNSAAQDLIVPLDAGESAAVEHAATHWDGPGRLRDKEQTFAAMLRGGVRGADIHPSWTAADVEAKIQQYVAEHMQPYRARSEEAEKVLRALAPDRLEALQAEDKRNHPEHYQQKE